MQFALDAATVLLGGTMAVWYLMLGLAVNAGPLDTPAAVVGVAVLAALRRPVAVGDTCTTAGGSVGVAQARDGEGVEELLRNADVAMYRAKAQGKGGYAVFAPEMYEALRDRVALEADLRRALDHDEFRVVYQPIVDLATERVVSAAPLGRPWPRVAGCSSRSRSATCSSWSPRRPSSARRAAY